MNRIITKQLQDISVAHRLINYNGKCENLHGHTYHCKVSIAFNNSYNFNEGNGISYDFNEFKKINNWLQDNWDHATLVSDKDNTLLEFVKNEEQRYYVINNNPTVENMVSELLNRIYDYSLLIINDDINYIEVEMWETDTSFYKQRLNIIRT